MKDLIKTILVSVTALILFIVLYNCSVLLWIYTFIYIIPICITVKNIINFAANKKSCEWLLIFGVLLGGVYYSFMLLVMAEHYNNDVFANLLRSSPYFTVLFILGFVIFAAALVTIGFFGEKANGKVLKTAVIIIIIGNVINILISIYMCATSFEPLLLLFLMYNIDIYLLSRRYIKFARTKISA